MAFIQKHARITDYFHKPAYPYSSDRHRQATVDAYENGKVVLFKDFRPDLDYEFLQSVDIPPHPDTRTHYKIAKLSEEHYLEIADLPRPEGSSRLPAGDADRVDPEVVRFLREDVFAGDRERLQRFARQIQAGHEQIEALFTSTFPDYEVTEVGRHWRFTESRAETLHIDAYEDDRHFHQVKLFINLDDAPRIWNLGEFFPKMIEDSYEDLGFDKKSDRPYTRFLYRANRELLHKYARFGKAEWRQDLGAAAADDVQGQVFPVHHCFFETGDVWMADTRFIPHQIFFGRRMASFQYTVAPESMSKPHRHLRHVLRKIHAAVRA